MEVILPLTQLIDNVLVVFYHLIYPSDSTTLSGDAVNRRKPASFMISRTRPDVSSLNILIGRIWINRFDRVDLPVGTRLGASESTAGDIAKLKELRRNKKTELS